MRLTEDEYHALLQRGNVREVSGERILRRGHEPTMTRGDATQPQVPPGVPRSMATKKAPALIVKPAGRKKPRQTDRFRSDTERRYAAVLEAQRLRGEIVDWRYEPMKGLYLGPDSSYTPDFLVIFTIPGASWCTYEFHEVKGGHIWPKDREKLKWAATAYPWFTFYLCQWKEQQWHITQVPA